MLKTSLLNKQSKSITGIDIAFKSISYSVQLPRTPFTKLTNTPQCKKIIDNISGIFKSGEVSAIMGSSGAGKTTLLNLMACRLPLKHSQGEITANNIPYDYELFGDFANYVMQTDIFMQTMTVRQTLTFAADLRLNMGQQQKERIVNDLAKNLKLDTCLDTLVGGSMMKGGISGGEKKRTSIAFELISDPQVVMLDEPTSGLDSLTSFIIVKYLSQLAKNHNKTIIMTIHQPNSDIFQLFDRLLLIVEGKLIYQGTANQSVEYFHNHFNLACPQMYNPADYFMSIMHQQSKDNVERYGAYFETYEEQCEKRVMGEIRVQNEEVFQKRKVEVGWKRTYFTLLRRDIKNVLRNPMLIKSRFFQTIFGSIYFGGLLCKVGQDYTNLITWQSLTGFFFFLSITSIFGALTPVTLTFPLQRDVFLKEQSSKLYGVGSYFLSKNTVQIPYSFLFPAIQALILYWFVGLTSTADQFFTFYLIILLSNLCGMSMGLLVGSVVRTPRMANVVAMIILFPVLVFSGYFKNQANLPPWNAWIQYLSPFKYAFSAFLQNQTKNRKSLLDRMNFDTGVWQSIGYLVALGVTCRIVSWFFLWALRKKLQ